MTYTYNVHAVRTHSTDCTVYMLYVRILLIVQCRSLSVHIIHIRHLPIRHSMLINSLEI